MPATLPEASLVYHCARFIAFVRLKQRRLKHAGGLIFGEIDYHLFSHEQITGYIKQASFYD